VPAKVDIEIAAKDRAKGVLARIGRTMQGLQKHADVAAKHARRVLIGTALASAGIIKLAANQEAAVNDLNIALDASGQGAALWGKQLQDLASRLQSTTIYGDEFLMGIMANATAMGVTANKMEDLLKMTLGLAKVTGQDLNAALRATILAQQGEYMMLRRYVPALRSAKTETEKMAAVQKTAHQGWLRVLAATKTMSGAIKQLKNLLGDLGEEMGAVIVPTIRKWVEQLKAALPPMMEWIRVQREVILEWGIFAVKILAVIVVLPKLIGFISALITMLPGLVIALGAVKMALMSLTLATAASTLGLTLMAGALGYAAFKAWQLKQAVSSLSRTLKQSQQTWEDLKKVRSDLADAELKGDLAEQLRLREEMSVLLQRQIAQRQRMAETEIKTGDLPVEWRRRAAIDLEHQKANVKIIAKLRKTLQDEQTKELLTDLQAGMKKTQAETKPAFIALEEMWKRLSTTAPTSPTPAEAKQIDIGQKQLNELQQIKRGVTQEPALAPATASPFEM